MATLTDIKKVLKWINGFKLFKLKFNNKLVGGIAGAKYYTKNDVLVIELINKSQDKIVVTNAFSYTYYNTPDGLTLVAENENYHKEFTIAGLYNIYSDN